MFVSIVPVMLIRCLRMGTESFFLVQKLQKKVRQKHHMFAFIVLRLVLSFPVYCHLVLSHVDKLVSLSFYVAFIKKLLMISVTFVQWGTADTQSHCSRLASVRPCLFCVERAVMVVNFH